MNNSQVAHLWANASRESAKGSNFYFEGEKIFSYGPHFPLAIRKTLKSNGKLVILARPDTYSPSTSRHKLYVWRAIGHLDTYSLNVDLWESVESEETLQNALAIQEKRNAENAEHAKEEKRARAKALRDRKKAEKLRESPTYFDEWRSGGALPAMAWEAPTALRLVGDKIETSKGASVPAKAARRLWPFLRAAKESGQRLTRPAFKWGDYTGAHLSYRGELIVGCHTIPFAELARMAETLGI